MDRTGLGQGQTLRLARLFDPNHIMVIDSSPFNGNQQFPEWYTPWEKTFTHGFPTPNEITSFLSKVDVVISCETFYNNRFTEIAKFMNKKTILIANYEFFDWHRPDFAHIPLPDKVVMPSYWHFDEMQRDYNATYIPTPLFEDDFSSVAQYNLNREGKRRYLFINGRQAIHDRNGLTTLYDALKYSKADFEVVVKAQGEIPLTDDPRVIYDLYDAPTTAEIYRDFDAVIMPRRYAGQCLPMTEALASALPVIMTDIDPNNKVLPKEWLFHATHMGTFMTRKQIELYSGEPKELAKLLDHFKPDKRKALDLSEQFMSRNVVEKYKELLEWK
jgi:glycosyltransferase involved in cell wall biosynthesis